MQRKELRVSLTDEAAGAVERIAAITERKPEFVVSDALRTYLWALREQARGRRIVSMNGGPDHESELQDLVRDRKAAEKYFRQLDWWPETIHK